MYVLGTKGKLFASRSAKVLLRSMSDAPSSMEFFRSDVTDRIRLIWLGLVHDGNWVETEIEGEDDAAPSYWTGQEGQVHLSRKRPSCGNYRYGWMMGDIGRRWIALHLGP